MINKKSSNLWSGGSRQDRLPSTTTHTKSENEFAWQTVIEDAKIQNRKNQATRWHGEQESTLVNTKARQQDENQHAELAAETAVSSTEVKRTAQKPCGGALAGKTEIGRGTGRLTDEPTDGSRTPKEPAPASENLRPALSTNPPAARPPSHSAAAWNRETKISSRIRNTVLRTGSKNRGSGNRIGSQNRWRTNPMQNSVLAERAVPDWLAQRRGPLRKSAVKKDWEGNKSRTSQPVLQDCRRSDRTWKTNKLHGNLAGAPIQTGNSKVKSTVVAKKTLVEENRNTSTQPAKNWNKHKNIS
jgi:hypothetical protein